MSMALVRREGGCTLADVMRVRRCTMREALAILRELQEKGLAARTGGGPKQAFRWVKS